MMRHPIFLTYGVLLLGFVSFANFRGLTPWRLSMPNTTPRAIRNNPGANRSIYGPSTPGRYSGGK